MSRSQHAQHLLGLHFLQKSVKKSKFWTLLIIVTQFYVKVEPNSTFLAPHIQSHCANIQPWREWFHFCIFFAQLSCEIKRWTAPKKVCEAPQPSTVPSLSLRHLLQLCNIQHTTFSATEQFDCNSWGSAFSSCFYQALFMHFLNSDFRWLIKTVSLTTHKTISIIFFHSSKTQWSDCSISAFP